jgi:hypothetical protein
MDNNFSPYMLADRSLRAGTVTLAIAIGLPWYRALSTVRVALPTAQPTLKRTRPRA